MSSANSRGVGVPTVWASLAHGAYLLRAMWCKLEQWMETKGLGARQLLSEMDKIHSMDVILPTDPNTTKDLFCSWPIYSIANMCDNNSGFDL